MIGKNLGRGERQVSTVVAALGLIAGLRGRSPILRTLSGAVGMGFLARSVAGHCAVKAAVSGQTSRGQGIKDQWLHITRTGSNPRLTARSAAQLSG